MTPKQHEMFQLIKAHIALTGCPPSYDQMMRQLGIKSRSTINFRLTKLQEHGLITWRKYVRGSLQLVTGTTPEEENKLFPLARDVLNSIKFDQKEKDGLALVSSAVLEDLAECVVEIEERRIREGKPT